MVVEGEKGPIDITPKELAVRTLTQEYGGGAFRISDDQLVFSNYKDQRLYKQHILHKGNNNTSLSLRVCLIGNFSMLFLFYFQIHLRSQSPLIMVPQLLLMPMESLIHVFTATLLLGKVRSLLL